MKGPVARITTLTAVFSGEGCHFMFGITCVCVVTNKNGVCDRSINYVTSQAFSALLIKSEPIPLRPEALRFEIKKKRKIFVA